MYHFQINQIITLKKINFFPLKKLIKVFCCPKYRQEVSDEMEMLFQGSKINKMF